MGIKTAREFLPDYAVPPGETVQEIIDSLNIAQNELAERTGRPKKTINEIIKGKAAITPETALQFERVLGVQASFWNALEQNYRAALARIAERERLDAQISWLKEIPVNNLVNAGWLKRRDDNVDQVSEVLSFYGVASADAWRDVWGEFRNGVAFRESRVFASDFGAVSAWLRKGELDARQIKTKPYDSGRFKNVLNEARRLTKEGPEIFCDALTEVCASAGVAVAFVPELPKLRVCGATRWLGPDKALIQLTLRYKTDDHLWFTFFHEASHILLHGKRTVFVEEVGGSAQVIRGVGSAKVRKVEEEENEANHLAGELLIPSADYLQFVEEGDFGVHAIRQFAESLEIAPGIVLGRLQHDKYLPFKTTLNTSIKRKFRWVPKEDPSKA